jgi:hypothetical protein
LALLALGFGLASWPPGAAQVVFRSPIPLTGPAQGPTRGDETLARQVTLFGVKATPGTATDPKLDRVESQLRKLLPGYGFRLLDVQTKRLAVDQTLTCDLEGGYTASATLLNPLDDNGKVRLRCRVLLAEAVQLGTDVSTPPNQLFFCDKALGDGSRLLIGVGAR